MFISHNCTINQWLQISLEPYYMQTNFKLQRQIQNMADPSSAKAKTSVLENPHNNNPYPNASQSRNWFVWIISLFDMFHQRIPYLRRLLGSGQEETSRPAIHQEYNGNRNSQGPQEMGNFEGPAASLERVINAGGLHQKAENNENKGEKGQKINNYNITG